MNIAEINQLTKASVGQLTSDAYRDAFNDPTTGKDFAAKIDALENAPKTPATETAARPHGNVRGPDATPASTSFDPSFDDAPAPAAAAPAPVQPAVPAPGPLAIWRYQPTDSQGRKVGGEQVFKYDPSLPNEHPQSLASQLTKAHSCATTALKSKRTQEFIESVTPEDTGYREPVRLSMFDHPEAERLNAMTDAAMNNGVLSALNLFKQRHPEFVLGEANAVAMLKWVEKSRRNPADGATWEAAWESLKPYLLPDEAEVQAAEAPAPAPAPVAVTPAPKRRVGGIPTGLSNVDNTSTDEPYVAPTVQGVRLVIDGKASVMDLRSWNRLPSDAQKRILRNATNASAIDALYRADDDRKAAARSGR